MPVSIKGSGGGGVTLDAGAAAANTTLTLPNVSGTVLQSGTAVTAAQGGTGLTSVGTAGNVLTSNGTIWTSTAPATTGVNVQSFTGSGTWTKPAYAAGSRVLIQAWGGGGSGSKQTSVSGGGGGGGYNERWLTLSAMGATETVTIGAGGTAVTTSVNGNTGGTTTVGSLISAYGGSGGSVTTSSLSYIGGNGGGQLSAGSNAGAASAGYALPRIVAGTDGQGIYYQGSGIFYGTDTLFTPAMGSAFWHGGGGDSGQAQNGGCPSLWGGGGGGAGTSSGGISQFGGNGGAGGTTGNGTAGTQPSGGGGGTKTGTSSGAGAAGQVIITVFPA